jgi:hypothetical protein
MSSPPHAVGKKQRPTAIVDKARRRIDPTKPDKFAINNSAKRAGVRRAHFEEMQTLSALQWPYWRSLQN